jgi:polyhydroxyalkanoate synthesis regulator phasin
MSFPIAISPLRNGSHEELGSATLRHLSQDLGALGVRAVRRWIERGELQTEKRGRSYVIRREDGERLKLGSLGHVLDIRSTLEDVLAIRDQEVAQLQGRYDELREHVARLEQQLDAERRRAIRLELELETIRGARLAA